MEADTPHDQARAYLRLHGQRAKARAEDDKSKAVGRSDWDAVIRFAAVLDELALIEGAAAEKHVSADRRGAR